MGRIYLVPAWVCDGIHRCVPIRGFPNCLTRIMPSLFTELRRRNVFKVGAAYAIVAWLLIEVSSVLLPTFNAPEWIMQVFTLFVILGFPITLLMAWAYEIAPEGIKAAADVPSDSITRATGQRLNYVILFKWNASVQ